MKKYAKAALAVLCAGILAALVFQVHLITLSGGQRALAYVPLSHGPGGSVSADLYDQLAALYGQEGAQAVPGIWQGEPATLHDATDYEFEYLGRVFTGGDYMLCTVTTTRTVQPEAPGQEPPPSTRRTSTCLGFDDADLTSSERAHILWETLREDYSDSEAYFNGLVPA